MKISTKGRGIIKAQRGTIARPNPKENYKLPEDQRYQAQTRGMKDFAIEWYKERAKQPKYQSQVNESNLANITDQINRAEYVEPTKFYSNPSVYKGNVGKISPNRINRRFDTNIPHQKITTDTSEFKYYEVDQKGRMLIKKLYLDPFMDLCNREILSHSISPRPSG